MVRERKTHPDVRSRRRRQALFGSGDQEGDNGLPSRPAVGRQRRAQSYGHVVRNVGFPNGRFLRKNVPFRSCRRIVRDFRRPGRRNRSGPARRPPGIQETRNRFGVPTFPKPLRNLRGSGLTPTAAAEDRGGFRAVRKDRERPSDRQVRPLRGGWEPRYLDKIGTRPFARLVTAAVRTEVPDIGESVNPRTPEN